MDQSCSTAKQKPLWRGSRGFTLTEVLVAGAVFMILSLGVISVYRMSVRTWHEGCAQVALQRKLSIAMREIMEGGRGCAENRQHGLREASNVNVLTPRTIEFTSGVDGAKREFYLNGNELAYRPANGSIETIYDPSRSGSPLVTSSSDTDVQFTQLSDGSVEVRLMGREKVGDRWVSASLVTRVAPRN